MNVSDCCNAPFHEPGWPDNDMCSKCHEHCGAVDDSEPKPVRHAVSDSTFCASIAAIESGIEYAKECLAQHDAQLGRTTLKNKSWAETIERDIAAMTAARDNLRTYDKQITPAP